MAGVTHFYGLYGFILPVANFFPFSFRTSEWAISRHKNAAKGNFFPRTTENRSDFISNFIGAEFRWQPYSISNH
jgi:hypothetical protein